MWDEAATKFAFEIGQVVAHKTNPRAKTVVIERCLNQCHGGIQRVYLCSHIGGAEGRLYRTHLNESELEKFDPDVLSPDQFSEIRREIDELRFGLLDLNDRVAKPA